MLIFIKKIEFKILIHSNFSAKLSHIHFKTNSHQNQIKYIQNIFYSVYQITNGAQLGGTSQMSG